jgi:hypothetical protein
VTTSTRARDLGLRSDSFQDTFPESVLPRVIAEVQAPTGVGKTHWCLEAPDPIVVFNFDQGLEGVIGKFTKKGKKIIVAGMPGTGGNGRFANYHFARPVPNVGENRKSEKYVQRVAAGALPMWERFVSDYREFLGSKARTGIVDTATAAFALSKFAYVGMDKYTSADDPYGQKSGNLKALFQGLVAEGLSNDKNVLWISRVKEEWKGGSPTGKMITDGYNQLSSEVQLAVSLGRDRDDYRKVTVLKSRYDRKFIGETFESGEKFDDTEFAFFMSEVTGTDERDWK